VPATAKTGPQRFRVAILDGDRPIRLAIEGRQPDGWYDLGPIEITGP
jgi:hypothetical protein